MRANFVALQNMTPITASKIRVVLSQQLRVMLTRFLATFLASASKAFGFLRLIAGPDLGFLL